MSAAVLVFVWRKEGGGVVGVTQQGNLLVIAASDSRAHAHTSTCTWGQTPPSNMTDGVKLIISDYIMNITAGWWWCRAEVTP